MLSFRKNCQSGSSQNLRTTFVVRIIQFTSLFICMVAEEHKDEIC
jgi:hypothetical protein